jgi:hypothetical protein
MLFLLGCVVGGCAVYFYPDLKAFYNRVFG